MNESRTGILYGLLEGGVLLGVAGGMIEAFYPGTVGRIMIDSLPLVTGVTGCGMTTGSVAAYINGRIQRKIETKIDAVFDSVLTVVRLHDKRMLPKKVNIDRKIKNQITLVYAVPIGYSLQDFYKVRPELEQATNTQIDLWIEGHYLYIRCYTAKIPKFINYSTPDLKAIGKPYPLAGVGHSCRGYEVWDIEQDAHLLGGGLTGTGKTGLIKYTIATMIENYSPGEIRILGIDPKRVGLRPFIGHPAVADVAIEEKEALEMLEMLNQELDNRGRLLNNTGHEKLSEYNAANPASKLPYLFLFIDEFTELTGPMVDSTERLLRMARYAGIHLAVFTQRPDAKVLPGGLKQNMSATVAFRCRNEVNSRILLDGPEAALLPKIKGRGVYQTDDNWIIQVPYIDNEEIKRIMRPYRSLSGPDDWSTEE